jgi:hypothetical protein
VCSITHGAILPACKLWLPPAPAATAGWRETAIVPTKARKAAKKSSEQKIRRKGDGVNVEAKREFVIMEFPMG